MHGWAHIGQHTSETRYIVRGYFSGDGQHWTRIYDAETGDYLEPFYRDQSEAIAYVEALTVSAESEPSNASESQNVSWTKRRVNVPSLETLQAYAATYAITTQPAVDVLWNGSAVSEQKCSECGRKMVADIYGGWYCDQCGNEPESKPFRVVVHGLNSWDFEDEDSAYAEYQTAVSQSGEYHFVTMEVWYADRSDYLTRHIHMPELPESGTLIDARYR